jgi:hypothetical protein
MAQASQGEGQGAVRGIGVDQVNALEGDFQTLGRALQSV